MLDTMAISDTRQAAMQGMVWVPAGTFRMGSDDHGLPVDTSTSHLGFRCGVRARGPGG